MPNKNRNQNSNKPANNVGNASFTPRRGKYYNDARHEDAKSRSKQFESVFYKVENPAEENSNTSSDYFFSIEDYPTEKEPTANFSISDTKENTTSIAVMTKESDDAYYGIFEHAEKKEEPSAFSDSTSDIASDDMSDDMSDDTSDDTYEDTKGEKEKKPSKNTINKSSKIKTVVTRTLAVIGTVLALIIVTVYVLGYTVANGPSETFRNMLVLSAMQASATKWAPGLFLSDSVVQSIVDDSNKLTVDQLSAEEYAKMQAGANASDTTGEAAPVDEWADSENGVKLITASGATFKAYITLVKDPSRVFVGVSSNDFNNATVGMNIFDMVNKYDALVGINGGEFADPGGMGTGATPIGVTFSNGSCVWGDSSNRTFIGFDYNNRLVVSEGMTLDRANALGIRDAVSFQNNNILIESSNGNINMYYAQSNTGAAQRTAIGQREDGTVILIVTDGRTASSIGATHNDMIDMMVSYGAVTAAMLDGGSSAMMYYENFYDKYDFDKSVLDEYQLRGLVNKYKAFVSPRTIPTYFLVRKEG